MANQLKAELEKSSHELAAELIAEHDALAEVQASQRVIYTEDEGLGSDDWQPSILRLAQGTTREVQERRAGIGQYVIENFAPEDEVHLVPLAVQLSRTLYEVDDQGRQDIKKPPRCVAPTGVKGIGDPGIECAKCPLKDWRNDPKTGKSTPPQCTAVMNLRAYSITHEDLVDFQFKGRSFKQGKTLQQQGAMKGFGSFAVKMGSKNESSAKGSWVEPTLLIGRVPVEEQERVERILHAVRKQLRPDGEELKAITG